MRTNFIARPVSSILSSLFHQEQEKEQRTDSAAVSHSLCAAKLAQPSRNGGRGEGHGRVCVRLCECVSEQREQKGECSVCVCAQAHKSKTGLGLFFLQAEKRFTEATAKQHILSAD